ncbi:MAG TPA: aspartate-semialdehyde dehydrogenase [Polyangiaceae bacterium]|jgi:aspartate-semialdehyde dehydrogenase|nr:aspartate-semialdehyde dehydrogenase [Polyangiaceae bacterium]
MKRVGIIGFRGMVGSVLVERMLAEQDFARIDAHFFSTSQKGVPAPRVGRNTPLVEDAKDESALRAMDVLISCQGGDYTKEMHPRLRRAGWTGYWIDAARPLRMEKDAIIVLDPVNRDLITKSIASGVRDYIGGNCTVSLMLMATIGLFRQGWVEWVSCATYQSASGAGAKHMRELVAQMRVAGNSAGNLLDDPASSILEIDRSVTAALGSPDFPKSEFRAPLAGSLIPWIDTAVADGQTREEWKSHVEANKILGANPEIPVDSVCVRVGAMRCHSQALTIKLRRDIPLPEIEAAIGTAHDWVSIVPNNPEDTVRRLSPAAVSGTLAIPVGRVRKMRLGGEYLSLFTVGDQLLWGAAEPLRRTLGILLEAS